MEAPASVSAQFSYCMLGCCFCALWRHVMFVFTVSRYQMFMCITNQVLEAKRHRQHEASQRSDNIRLDGKKKSSRKKGCCWPTLSKVRQGQGCLLWWLLCCMPVSKHVTYCREPFGDQVLYMLLYICCMRCALLTLMHQSIVTSFRSTLTLWIESFLCIL